MKYWVRIDGHASSQPLTKEELFSKYGDRLTADTPCAKVGESTWEKLGDVFPDWQNPNPESVEAAMEKKAVTTRQNPATLTTVTDIDIPFGRLVVILLKTMLAAIPALILFYLIFFICGLILMTLFGGGVALLHGFGRH